MKRTVRSLFTLMTALSLITYTCFASPRTQSKGTGNASNNGGGQGNQGGQTGTGQGGSNSAAGNRIEAAMLAYDASNEIAKKIAETIKPFLGSHDLFIYDSQSFSSLQTYDAYAAAVSTLEADFSIVGEQVSAAREQIQQGEQEVERINQQILAVTRKTAEVTRQTEALTSSVLETEQNLFEKYYKVQIAAGATASESTPPSSAFTTATGGIQTVLGLLGAIRSTSEYAGETVDFSLDAVIAQLVAQQLGGRVIIPKMILLSDNDLTFPKQLSLKNCSDIANTIPHQLACLTKIRNEVASLGDANSVSVTTPSSAGTGKEGAGSSTRTISYLSSQAEKLLSDAKSASARAKTARDEAARAVSAARTAAANAKDRSKADKLTQDANELDTLAGGIVSEAERALSQANKVLLTANEATNAFAPIDKVFQAFFAGLMGASVSTTTSSGQDKAAAAGSTALSLASQAGNPAGGISNPSPAGSVLSSVVLGHRLRRELSESKGRILVLETVVAGGGQRIKHNFFAEVFYATPTPTFTGGAIVTYLLIDPSSSRVESANVFRFIYDYGKFHGKKSERASNY